MVKATGNDRLPVSYGRGDMQLREALSRGDTVCIRNLASESGI